MREGNVIEDLVVSVKLYKEDIFRWKDDPEAMRKLVDAALGWVEDAILLAMKGHGIQVKK